MALEEGELCFPHLLNASCRKPNPPRSETLIVDVVLYIIAAVTAALNLLVIVSISHFRKLHTPTNLLLLSLAVSDFLVGFLVMPIEVNMVGNCWMFSDLLCVLYFLLPITTTTASMGNMLLICVDRYVAICEPMHYHSKVTQKIATGCILLFWTSCLFYSVFLLYDSLKQPGRFKSCHGECVIDIVGAAGVVLGFIIPISLIVVLYSRVFMVVVSQARAMKSQITAVAFTISKPARAKKSEVKAATTLGIVVVVFLMCTSPYYCLSLSGHTISIGSSIEVIMINVMYINSCLNPLIYAMFYPWFRKAVKIIVTLQIMESDSCKADLM